MFGALCLFGSPAADLPVAVKNINLFECRMFFFKDSLLVNQASIDAVSFPGAASGRGSLHKIETREIKVATIYRE